MKMNVDEPLVKRVWAKTVEDKHWVDLSTRDQEISVIMVVIEIQLSRDLVEDFDANPV